LRDGEASEWEFPFSDYVAGLRQHGDVVQYFAVDTRGVFHSAPLARSSGGIDEQAIVSFVRSAQPVAAREIGEQIGVSGNRLSVKLGRMVSAGLLTKTGERRGTRYSVS
jgi:hypothetical protein